MDESLSNVVNLTKLSEINLEYPGNRESISFEEIIRRFAKFSIFSKTNSSSNICLSKISIKSEVSF